MRGNAEQEEDQFTSFYFFKTGNGPSGICLSYMLSGYRPYLSPEVMHPNSILHSKLEEARHLSIVDQVLCAVSVLKDFNA